MLLHSVAPGLVKSMGPGDLNRPPGAIPNWRTFDRDAEAAGLPKEDKRGRILSLYSMRKTFSTHLRLCGVDDDMISRLMRHSGQSLNSKTYTEEDLLELREPMRMLDERDCRSRGVWREIRRDTRTMRAASTPTPGRHRR